MKTFVKIPLMSFSFMTHTTIKEMLLLLLSIGGEQENQSGFICLVFLFKIANFLKKEDHFLLL